jgi:divalent metal cation (Fe/Co/Zn/Cd) transporter
MDDRRDKQPFLSTSRYHLLKRGLELERWTIGWNLVEAFVAIGAGMAAGSIALIGFGLDSGIELIAGVALYRRLGAELRGIDAEDEERHERIALRTVGITFMLLGAYVLYEALTSLVTKDEPSTSFTGIALSVLSLIVMPFLAFAKLRTGRGLASAALVADAKETLVCAYLSFALLLGLALNAAFGWWWADPVAALAMVPYLLFEGWEALSGDDD